MPRARELVAPLKQGAQRFAEVVEALVWCDETEKELAISSFVETVHIHIHIHIFIFIFISLYSAINIPLHFFSVATVPTSPKVGGIFSGPGLSVSAWLVKHGTWMPKTLKVDSRANFLAISDNEEMQEWRPPGWKPKNRETPQNG